MHLLVLLLIFGDFLHDAQGGVAWSGGGPLQWALLVLGPKLAFGALYALLCRLSRSQLGGPRTASALRRVDRAGSALRTALLLLYANDLRVGGLTAVRLAVGDHVLLDEVLFMLPTLAALTWAWSAYFPIDRRLRESSLVRALDRGEPMPPLLSRGQYLLSQWRHQVLILLVPLWLVYAWAEAVVFYVPDVAVAGIPLGPPLQLVGTLVVMALAPLLIRFVWDTTPLPPGELRDTLTAMCKAHRVGVAQLLLWRTYGGMINAAVMGVVAPVRYILLTDGLLQHVRREQVEAVMAHELAHVRRHHLPWLGGAAMALVTLAQAGAMLAIEAAALLPAPPPPSNGPVLAGPTLAGALGLLARHPQVLQWTVVATAVLAAAGAFGWVSRRFERQADTFAVQHLSRNLPIREHTLDPHGRRLIDPHAVAVMTEALQQVAVLNHIRPTRRSWRHGSIAWRQAYLARLSHTPLESPAIDATVRAINAATLLVLVVTAVVSVMLWR